MESHPPGVRLCRPPSSPVRSRQADTHCPVGRLWRLRAEDLRRNLNGPLKALRPAEAPGRSVRTASHRPVGRRRVVVSDGRLDIGHRAAIILVSGLIFATNSELARHSGRLSGFTAADEPLPGNRCGATTTPAATTVRPPRRRQHKPTATTPASSPGGPTRGEAGPGATVEPPHTQGHRRPARSPVAGDPVPHNLGWAGRPGSCGTADGGSEWFPRFLRRRSFSGPRFRSGGTHQARRDS